MNESGEFQLKLRAPFAVLGAQCDDYAIFTIAYLPLTAPELPPQNPLAAELARQIRAYLRNPKSAAFDLPLYDAPTPASAESARRHPRHSLRKNRLLRRHCQARQNLPPRRRRRLPRQRPAAGCSLPPRRRRERRRRIHGRQRRIPSSRQARPPRA